MMRGEYTGPRESLKGQRALLQNSDRREIILAQFNDVATGFGYGWHAFDASHFRIDSKS